MCWLPRIPRGGVLDFHYSNAVKNSIYGLESQAQTKKSAFLLFYDLNLMNSMIKNFSSFKIKIWFKSMFLQVFWRFFSSWQSRTDDNFKFFFGGIQFRIHEANI